MSKVEKQTKVPLTHTHTRRIYNIRHIADVYSCACVGSMFDFPEAVRGALLG